MTISVYMGRSEDLHTRREDTRVEYTVVGRWTVSLGWEILQQGTLPLYGPLPHEWWPESNRILNTRGVIYTQSGWCVAQLSSWGFMRAECYWDLIISGSYSSRVSLHHPTPHLTSLRLTSPHLPSPPLNSPHLTSQMHMINEIDDLTYNIAPSRKCTWPKK